MSSRYAKEFHRLKQSLEKKTNGQAFIKDWDPDNITSFIVEVSPLGGPYKKGKFLFQIIVPELYPDVHPDVVCLTDIYHPNIDSDITDEHNICLNLFDEWNKSFGLEDCVQGLIFLLYNPNLSDPISSFFDGSLESQASFASKVQASLRGESFDGISFAKNPGYIEMENPTAQDNEKKENSPSAVDMDGKDKENGTEAEAKCDSDEKEVQEKPTENGAVSTPEFGEKPFTIPSQAEERTPEYPDLCYMAVANVQPDSPPNEAYCSADELRSDCESPIECTTERQENGYNQAVSTDSAEPEEKSEAEVAVSPQGDTPKEPSAVDSMTVPEADDAKVEATQADDAKVEATQANDAKVEATQADDAKVEATQTDDAMVEATQVDDAKVEATQTDDAKVEATQTDDAKVEATQTDDAKVEATQTDDAKVEATQTDDAKVEATQADDAKVEATQADDAKVQATQADDVKVEVAQAGDYEVEVAQAVDLEREVMGVIIKSDIDVDPETDPIVSCNDSTPSEDSSGEGGHANFMPYEEAEFSWNEQVLNEEQPFMDALGCRFLYSNQSESTVDDAEFESTDGDDEGDDDDFIFTDDDDDDDDDADEWDYDDEMDNRSDDEVIDLGNSRIIIRPLRRRNPRRSHRSRRHRGRRREIVVEEVESGVVWPLVRRTLSRGVAALRPHYSTLWPSLTFWELGAVWTACVFLFGNFSSRRRVTRRVLR